MQGTSGDVPNDKDPNTGRHEVQVHDVRPIPVAMKRHVAERGLLERVATDLGAGATGQVILQQQHGQCERPRTAGRDLTAGRQTLATRTGTYIPLAAWPPD